MGTSKLRTLFLLYRFLSFNFFYNLILKLTSTLFILFATIVLARVLGPDGFGLYTFAFVIITLLLLPINSGLGTLLIREVAVLEQNKDWSHFRGLLLRSAQLVILLSIIISSSIFFTMWALDSSLNQVTSLTFVWAQFILPFLAAVYVFKSLLIGLRHAVKGQIPELIVRPLLLAILLLFAYWMGKGGFISPDNAMAINLVVVIACVVISIYFFAKNMPAQIW